MPFRRLFRWLSLLPGGLALAQQPQDPARRISVHLRNPAGQIVPDAEAWLLPFESPDLVALRGTRPPAPPIAALRGQERQRGQVVFANVATGVASGAVLATTPGGLGGIVADIAVGEATRLQLQPMAEVTTAEGSEPFELWAAWHGDRVVMLPPQQGMAIRLPAGTFEVWAKNADGFVWRRLELTPGGRAVLTFAGPGRVLQRHGGAVVSPTGWPHVRLLDDRSPTCTLLGTAAAAPLTSWTEATGAVLDARVVPGAPSPTPLPWPPPEVSTAEARTLFLRNGDHQTLPAGTEVTALRRADDGSLRLLGRWQVKTSPIELAWPGRGDDWLLVTAEGMAPVARDALHEPDRPVELNRGADIEVQLRSPTGEPLPHVLVEFLPDGLDIAAIGTRSDSRGRVLLTGVALPGILRTCDPRHGNVEHVIDAGSGRSQLEVPAGAVLAGVARYPDGSVATGAIVTLRDPRGRLRPAERSAIADASGNFTFTGLGDDDALVLFATILRQGRTWSARLPNIRAGGADLELRSEDPDPPAPRDR
ncbi:MAG: hypothetical protein IPK26_29620 [Planctomycetes bacterium]|nr:hypothetical protein [Planctomycetota bacterium]